ncbi:MAG: hypothetical protein KAJ24_03125, partial [Candidatus Aenigmarchaeota archaeon]|nr:hypothetical protein [Candidatus Aenigmarchaeota archaeon]
MQIPSKQDIEDSIESAEKYLNENELNQAENKYYFACRCIEAHHDMGSNDSKLSEFSRRLVDIKAKIAVGRMNQVSHDGAEGETNYNYLLLNLRMVLSGFYSDHRDIIRKYNEYEQSGERKTGGRLKDFLT